MPTCGTTRRHSFAIAGLCSLHWRAPQRFRSSLPGRQRRAVVGTVGPAEHVERRSKALAHEAVVLAQARDVARARRAVVAEAAPAAAALLELADTWQAGGRGEEALRYLLLERFACLDLRLRRACRCGGYRGQCFSYVLAIVAALAPPSADRRSLGFAEQVRGRRLSGATPSPSRGVAARGMSNRGNAGDRRPPSETNSGDLPSPAPASAAPGVRSHRERALDPPDDLGGRVF